MAKYEHLPIFKAMMDLAIEVERAVQHFPRSHKYALGAELRALCHQGLGLIAEANSSPVAGRSYQGGTKGGEGVALAVDNSASRSRSRSLDEAKRNPGALLKEGGAYRSGAVGASCPLASHGNGGDDTPRITYRAGFLLQLRLTLERLKIHLLLAKEVQAFNRARTFYRITELTVAVSRQNEGWLKSMAG